MKKYLALMMAMCLPLVTFAQSNSEAKQLTKFEEFTSKTGSIVKFVDVSMPSINLIYGSLVTSIRTIKSSSDAYFYRLEKNETSSSLGSIAMIEYSDLVEINKALDKLSSEVENDIMENPDYLENKFRTVDGFEVGYFVSKGKASWYLRLERYNNSTVFVKYPELLIDSFKTAQNKIEELKAANQ